MKLFDVYPLFDVNIVKGKGCHVWDDKGQEYLDLYGGHAVISIGHAHPHYVETISKQVATLGFYSNSVINKLQQEVADRPALVRMKFWMAGIYSNAGSTINTASVQSSPRNRYLTIFLAIDLGHVD